MLYNSQNIDSGCRADIDNKSCVLFADLRSAYFKAF